MWLLHRTQIMKKNILVHFLRLLAVLLVCCAFVGCTTIPSMSTRDLKLEHAQHERMVTGATEAHGDAWKHMENRRRKMEKIERELHKRYQAGDKEAYLSIFAR